MPFDKRFFDQISDHLNRYYRIFPCGVVTLTIQTRTEVYNVQQFLNKDENLLTFTYYSHPKSKELALSAQEKSGEKRAWPAVTVPYEEIILVDFNPSTDSTIGFKLPGSNNPTP